jgi:hypothetical protein
MEILSGASLLLQCMFLIQFSFKIDGNPLWSPVHVSYSVLIQIEENPFWSLPPHPVYVSYSILIQN